MSDEATTAEAGSEQEAPATPAIEAAPETPEEPAAEEAPAEDGAEPAEPEGEQSAEPEAVEPAAPEAPSLPPAAVARAVQAGMSIEEILEHDTPAALERACALLERRAPKGEAGAVQRQQPAEPLEFKLDFTDPVTGVDIPEDQMDPVMMKNLKGMAQAVNAIQKAALMRINDLRSGLRAIQTQAHVEWLDGAIAGLGEQYQGILGKGTIHDLDPRGAPMQARIKLDNAMATIASGYVARGQQVPNKKVLLTQAVNMTFGDHAKSQARKEVAAKLDARAGQMTARPSQRAATPPPQLTPDEEARAAARAVMAKKGLLNSEDTTKPKRRK